MEFLRMLLQVVVALSILNVWLIRANRATPYRGGNATTLAEEFSVYGLSRPVMLGVGALKVSLSLLLLIGVWYRPVVPAAAALMGAIMAVAVLLHFKVGDPLVRSMPASCMLILCVAVFMLAQATQ